VSLEEFVRRGQRAQAAVDAATRPAVQRHPLAWPLGWARTPARDRKRAEFRKMVNAVDRQTGQVVRTERGRAMSERALTLHDALARLERELRLLEAADEILSTNIRVGLNGVPRSGQAEPEDPGAAVYFQLAGKATCLACDRWDRVADNVAAIAQHIDALRRIDRYGVGTRDQAFAGYAQLGPAPVEWWLLLEVKPSATLDQVDDAFRRLSRIHHPDVGGDTGYFAKLSEAREAARRALGAV